MKITFNQDRLNKLLFDIYQCTGIPITMFDNNFNRICACGTNQDFCLEIRSNQQLLEKCNFSDREHFLEAKAKKDSIIYTCHAGICEMITPIFYNNILIAYLILGKFRDKDGKYTSQNIVSEHIDKYNLDKNDMLKKYAKLPIFSDTFLQSTISLLNICICYIWSENLIQLTHNTLPLQIENYIANNLDSPITVASLCKQFFVGKQTLYEIFRNEFNDTVKNYILKKRIAASQQMLTTTDKPISDIAESVGFTDYNYFIRIFKQKIGTTPLNYRKRNAQANGQSSV